MLLQSYDNLPQNYLKNAQINYVCIPAAMDS